MTDLEEEVSLKKQDQGQHECEVWGHGPEVAEGALAWKKCMKNPGHPNFIPAHEFSMHHIPAGEHQTEEMVNMVRHLTALTVRLNVAYTSTSRPCNYPFFSFGGQSIPHTGSGMVKFGLDMPWVLSSMDEYESVEDGSLDDSIIEGIASGDGPCSCPECKQEKSTSMRKWWSVPVLTAKHVVFDSEEAKRTKVIVVLNEDYDSVGDAQVELRNCQGTQEKQASHRNGNFIPGQVSSKDDDNLVVLSGDEMCKPAFEKGEQAKEESKEDTNFNKEMKTLPQKRIMYGRKLLGSDVTTDRSWLQCVTHDKNLVKQMLHHFLCLERARGGFLKKHSSGAALCIVVSHPHGCHKTVSVGSWKERELARKDKQDGSLAENEMYSVGGGSGWVKTEYRYDSPTCPGSSGGPVLILGGGIGMVGQSDNSKGAVLPCHSWGGKGNGVLLNGSGPWWEKFNPHLDS